MLNKTSRTFKGHSNLTVAKANQMLAVAVTGLSSRKGEETVNTTTAENAPLIGAYSANPGHENNEVSVDVIGEFEIAMKAAVVVGDLGKGVVASDTAGLAKPVNLVGTVVDGTPDTVALSYALGRIIGGRSEGTKHFARIIV